MKPKPLSVNFLMVPSAICVFPVVTIGFDAPGIRLPTSRPSVARVYLFVVPSRKCAGRNRGLQMAIRLTIAPICRQVVRGGEQHCARDKRPGEASCTAGGWLEVCLWHPEETTPFVKRW